MKEIKWIMNPREPTNFKEYGYIIDALFREEEKLLHQRKKLNIELKKIRTFRKHLLDNPVLQDVVED